MQRLNLINYKRLKIDSFPHDLCHHPHPKIHIKSCPKVHNENKKKHRLKPSWMQRPSAWRTCGSDLRSQNPSWSAQILNHMRWTGRSHGRRRTRTQITHQVTSPRRQRPKTCHNLQASQKQAITRFPAVVLSPRTHRSSTTKRGASPRLWRNNERNKWRRQLGWRRLRKSGSGWTWQSTCFWKFEFCVIIVSFFYSCEILN